MPLQALHQHVTWSDWVLQKPLHLLKVPQICLKMTWEAEGMGVFRRTQLPIVEAGWWIYGVHYTNFLIEMFHYKQSS